MTARGTDGSSALAHRYQARSPAHCTCDHTSAASPAPSSGTAKRPHTFKPSRGAKPPPQQSRRWAVRISSSSGKPSSAPTRPVVLLTHPLGLMIDQQPWIRSPRAVGTDGSMLFYAQVIEGTDLRS
jgi:hypothetical protein